jgi:phage virion morphogenesis protein
MIEVTVRDTVVQDALRALIQRGTNMRPLFNAIQLELVAETERAFAKQGYPTRWKPLAPATIALRTKKGTWPGKMLQVSAGGLAASVQGRSTDRLAMITAGKKYAAIQQFGGQAGRGRKVAIPARPYLPLKPTGGAGSRQAELNEPVRRAILDLIADHFTPN